jgi:hypothetical protein
MHIAVANASALNQPSEGLAIQILTALIALSTCGVCDVRDNIVCRSIELVLHRFGTRRNSGLYD